MVPAPTSATHLIELRQGLEVPVDHVNDSLDDGVPLRGRDEAHHPEVDVGELAARRDQ